MKESKIKLILKEQGKSANWLADEVKRKFGRTKKWTFGIINNNKVLDINDKIIFAFCLGISYKDFN